MEVFQNRGDVALRDVGSAQLRGWTVALGDLKRSLPTREIL